MRITSTQNMSAGQVVKQALIFSAAGFVIWMILVGLVYGLLRLSGFDFEFWPMLEAVSTAAAVAQFFGGGAVALWQLRDSADSRNLGIYNDIFEKLMSNENIEARRWIYTSLPEDPRSGIDSLDAEGQRHMKTVLNSLDHLGFLMDQDWITGEGEQAIIKWVSPFVVKCWVRLAPYIAYEAERRHEPDYYDSIRHLAQRCLEWRSKNLPEARVTWVGKSL